MTRIKIRYESIENLNNYDMNLNQCITLKNLNNQCKMSNKMK